MRHVTHEDGWDWMISYQGEISARRFDSRRSWGMLRPRLIPRSSSARSVRGFVPLFDNPHARRAWAALRLDLARIPEQSRLTITSPHDPKTWADDHLEPYRLDDREMFVYRGHMDPRMEERLPTDRCPRLMNAGKAPRGFL